LNTDQTPATFWITHPDNEFKNNVAAGSDRYGFWFDLDDTPKDTFVRRSGDDRQFCPKGDKLGSFVGNSSHSYERYGLRIFHGLIPRDKPCEPYQDEVNYFDNPFQSNTPIEAVFEN